MSERRPDRQRRRQLTRGGVEPVVRVDPVDHVPALERLGAEQLPGHDQLARPSRAGPLGEALGAAHRRRQSDHSLDEPEAGRLRGEDQVAGQRELERPRQAQGVGGEHGRAGQQVDAAGDRDQSVEQLGGGLRPGLRVEHRHVHTAADDSALGPEQHRAGGGALELRRSPPPVRAPSGRSYRLTGGESMVTTARPPSRSSPDGAAAHRSELGRGRDLVAVAGAGTHGSRSGSSA